MATRGVCPMHKQDVISDAIDACPFMKAVCDAEGKGFARRLALNPFASAPGSLPVFPEDALGSFDAVVKLFHGDKGVIPLQKFSEAKETKGCPFHASTDADLKAPSQRPSMPAPHPLAGAPMASISLSGPFGFLVSSLSSSSHIHSCPLQCTFRLTSLTLGDPLFTTTPPPHP